MTVTEVAAGGPAGAPPASPPRPDPVRVDDAGDIYRQLAPAVLGYLRAERAPDPEDLCGEVFLQVVRDLPRFRGDADGLRRWVFTIAHHRLVDARRRAARRPRRSAEVVPDVPAPPQAFEGGDPELAAALAGLTPEQREVLVLRFVADLAIEDVAKIMGRSRGAVKALQHRALDALGACLPPDGGGC